MWSSTENFDSNKLLEPSFVGSSSSPSSCVICLSLFTLHSFVFVCLFHVGLSFSHSLVHLFHPLVICARRSLLFVRSFVCLFHVCLSFVHSLVRLLIPLALCVCRFSLFVCSFCCPLHVCSSLLCRFLHFNFFELSLSASSSSACFLSCAGGLSCLMAMSLFCFCLWKLFVQMQLTSDAIYLNAM